VVLNGFVNVALVQAASPESLSAVASWCSLARLIRDLSGGERAVDDQFSKGVRDLAVGLWLQDDEGTNQTAPAGLR
jgi:hypothetical protein